MNKDICVIALNLSDEILNVDCDYIGVDKGALFLANAKVHMKLAIGDFDSISENEFQLIKNFADEIISFPAQKDESDSELAIKYGLNLGYEHLIITGGLSKRIDHSFNNLLLALKYHPADITFRDKDNKAYILSTGIHMISKSHYKYISFFPLHDSIITLMGFKYNLEKTTLSQFNNLGLSNEIIQEFGSVIVDNGYVMVIQSND